MNIVLLLRNIHVFLVTKQLIVDYPLSVCHYFWNHLSIRANDIEPSILFRKTEERALTACDSYVIVCAPTHGVSTHIKPAGGTAWTGTESVSLNQEIPNKHGIDMAAVQKRH
ncbi:hypothetical protein GOODEAATRI_027109 [Goodea atripinnis]|uniref:Uncharacterized protein n=1 Tax=Goodea atripinnis TaxID=208336 RepID=A0ABV0Q1L9_9TELE